MIIREYRPKDQLSWDEYVVNHPYSLPYHLTAWKAAVEKAYRFKGCYLVAETGTENGGNIIGILPLIRHHIPFVKGQLVSLPFCDAAGPLADSKEIENALIKEAFKIGRQNGIKNISIRSIRPFAGINKEHTLNKNKVRMLLKLPDNSKTLMASFKAKLRSQIKKPIKDGLTAQIGSTELLDLFYPLFSRNMRDLGSPVHSKKWLKSILKAYKNRAHIVMVYMPDSTPAAGGLILSNPSQISVPWASSLRCFNRWNPNMLLYWTFLKFAADNGFPIFDFGRSTPGEGTFRFKKQWGAEPAFLHWSDFKLKKNGKDNLIPTQFSGSITDNKYRGKIEAVIMRTPVLISTAFGSFIRKYITL